VFICHASEDKATFVRPLAEALRERHVSVWYDEFELKLGDSIRRAIDKGLSQSRFGIVVLSTAFFSKEWPQYELDALVDREITSRAKLLLPIWHGVAHQDVAMYSPVLAGRRAASSSSFDKSFKKSLTSCIRPVAPYLLLAMRFSSGVSTQQSSPTRAGWKS
jgi:hypothetical protein